jgi:AcrR family transcriptional regulator
MRRAGGVTRLTVSTRRATAERAARSTTRARILTAARKLWFAEGPAGVTARRIAQAVGCSPTAIYLYFRSLGELLEQLRLEGHALLAERLRAASAGRAPRRLAALGRAYYRFGTENPRFYALMFGLDPVAPSRRAVQREMFTLMFLQEAVHAGIARGELRRDLDPLVATNALWAQMHGVTALAVSGLLVETADGHPEAVFEAVLASAIRGVVP